MKNVVKYIISVLLIFVILFGIISNFVIAVEAENIDMTAVSGGQAIKTIIKDYAYSAPSYHDFDLFPLDRVEFDKYPDRFCGEHNVEWGVNYPGTPRRQIKHELNWDGHQSNSVTDSRATGKAGPYDDIPTTNPDAYCDSGGSLVRKDDDKYFGYIDETKKEQPSEIVTTNWVYNSKPMTFSCETGGGTTEVSDTSISFLLACYKQPGSRYYSDDPLQHAVWTWLNSSTKGRLLEPDGHKYESYHVASENPDVDCYPDSSVGTVLQGDTYAVGPFTMSNYVRAKDYELTAGYFGNLEEAFQSQSPYKGTVIKAEAVLNNGKKVEFTPPEPGEVFTIPLSSADCAGADEVKDIIFTYERVHACGKGTFWTGNQYELTYDFKSQERSSCRYYCQDDTGSGGRHFYRSPGSSSVPYKKRCYHEWYTGCRDWTTTEEKEETTTNPDGTTTTTKTTEEVDHHECGTYHSYSHSDPYLCEHDHEDCRRFEYKFAGSSDRCQDGFAGNGKLVDEIDEFKVCVEVPLKTEIRIYKYIEQVEHIGETGIIFGETAERMPRSMSDKYNDPVHVERGDLVKYRIILTNGSRFNTVVKVKDTLPVDCDLAKMDSAIGASTSIVVPAHGQVEYEVWVIPTKAQGLDTNTIELITKNDPGSEHMKYEHWGDGATHGPHSMGNIVNTDGNDGTTNLKEKDSDTYKIKEYSVNIKKYIYDVNHKAKANSDLDTSMQASLERAAMAEMEKANNPVYVEYGDTVEYNIVVYNTTSDYDPSIDNSADPFFNPDKVYVNIEDTLPKKYSDIEVIVKKTMMPGDDIYDYSVSGNQLKITDLMVPANGFRIITVRLTVEEDVRKTVEVNTAKLGDKIKNINRGTGSIPYDDKYCIIHNNPISTESSDYYKLNNYNTFIDKYISKYDEVKQEINNTNKFTENGIVTNDQEELIVPRYNDSKIYEDYFDDNVNDRRRVAGNKEQYKKEHPLSAEKGERITYDVRISNEAQTIEKAYESSKKPATQVRPSQIRDLMEVGLRAEKCTVVHYDVNGNVKFNIGEINLPTPRLVEVDGRKYNEYIFSIGNETILDPGEYITYSIVAEIEESNMYLYDLENRGSILELTNINNVDNRHREVTEQNISTQPDSREYIRMKDLVISGTVWLDLDRDGLMDDTVDVKDVAKKFYKQEFEDKDTDGKLSSYNELFKKYYNVNDDARKKDVVVKLYRVGVDAPIRTTKTDVNGLFTFSRDENLKYYDTFNYNNQYDANKIYQRVDKADKKDANGNYTKDSQLIEYYIEYEYDGVIYKSTEFYAVQPGETAEDVRNKEKTGKENIEADGSILEEKNYKKDSNAYEFRKDREEFNKNYEYISYNVAYDVDKAQKTNDLVFDKNGHNSYLLEDNSRTIKARSFINKQPENTSDKDLNETTNTLWLFKFDNNGDNQKPETEYLKYINLGLELRENVDIALTKDVYKVKTTIDGEEMEYVFNQNGMLNGEELIATTSEDGKEIIHGAINQGVDKAYLKDYIIANPYGLEIYEADYKYRVEQYKADRVKAYKGVNGENELNIEVTYRIALDNKRVSDDDTINGSRDTNLDVRVSEVLDLYDENFKDIKFDESTGKMSDSGNDVVLKIKDENGFLVNNNEEPNPKPLKVAEAWYYKKGTTQELEGNSNRYSIMNPNGSDKQGQEQPVYQLDLNGEYIKVPLELANKSIRNDSASFTDKANDFKADGYKTVYITGMENEIIKEGERLNIYVKYVVDKDALDTKVTNDNYEDTVNTEDVKEATVEKPNGAITIRNETIEGKTVRIAKILRSLKLAEKTEGKINPRGTENIAQINAYSVWYENSKPASLVDMDSNAGNIGIKSNKKAITDINGTPGYSEENTSADDYTQYEDNTYKTGIEIFAEGTENTKEEVKTRHPNIIVEAKAKQAQIERKIKGTVWDDARTTSFGPDFAKQYSGDGINQSKLGDRETNNGDAKMNDNVPLNYKDDEKDDLEVRNAKVQFIEIVKMPFSVPGAEEIQKVAAVSDDTVTTHYYEEVLNAVTWKQVQHTRTNDTGDYELEGFIPGNYIVRFTYGDTIDVNSPDKSKQDEQTIAKNDMLVFNGQDYKSTKYAKEINDNETDVDKVLTSLELKDRSDARDDEIRRLEVNKYSEKMTNYLAEILKGSANGNNDVTPLSQKNTEFELKEFTDNTFMNAETREFKVKPEKLTYDQIKVYPYKVLYQGIDEKEGIKVYYDALENLKYQFNIDRNFNIENVDFGIEYRPESQIGLEKEISEIKLTTQDGAELIHLYLYTVGEGENVVHMIDEEKSTGLDKTQFISNSYRNHDPLNMNDEKTQGFAYLQVDDQILQGSKVDIVYKFKAQNNSEVDRISKKLNILRFKDNENTLAVLGSANNIEKNYTASGSARNQLYNEYYSKDINSNEYRKYQKKLINIDDVNSVDGLVDLAKEYDKNIGYFGKYNGYSYYKDGLAILDVLNKGEKAAKTYNDIDYELIKKDIDIISSIKFDKILDYIDVDLEYEQETNKDLLENKAWHNVETVELINYLSKFRNERFDETIGRIDKSSNLDNLKLVNPDGIEYTDLVVSNDDRTSDKLDPNNADFRSEIADEEYISNKFLSRYLIPKTVEDKLIELDIVNNSKSNIKLSMDMLGVDDPKYYNKYYQSLGTVYLPVSKVIAQESDTKNMSYENVAEIIEFTTQTGRRTNFNTTIGNAEFGENKDENVHNLGTAEEFLSSTYEVDTAATETITLTPPTGLMKNRQLIVDTVETAQTGIIYTISIGAVVLVVIFIINSIRYMIKNRRYK